MKHCVRDKSDHFNDPEPFHGDVLRTLKTIKSPFRVLVPVHFSGMTKLKNELLRNFMIKYRRVQRSTGEYNGVQGSTGEYRGVQQSTTEYLVYPH